MESAFARTPEPPYFAVIFTSQRTEGDQGYDAMAGGSDGGACDEAAGVSGRGKRARRGRIRNNGFVLVIA